jgi:phosphoserine phosphatase
MSKIKKATVALIYDFDGTLSPGNMQEFGFIKAIGKNKDEFWTRSRELSENNDANPILCYMYLMLSMAQKNNVSLKRSFFQNFGKDIQLFKGVLEWFKLITDYGKDLNLDVKHYIISSGLKEMIEGTEIAKYFENIYACSFLYNVDGVALWPAVAVDYTAKTQFLFKINKGIKEVSDNQKINAYIPENERPVPFQHMIYFGDGETDIPCMKMVKYHGGNSIAVYRPHDKNKKAIAEKLISQDRVNFVCMADYTVHKDIYRIVTTILNKIKTDLEYEALYT